MLGTIVGKQREVAVEGQAPRAERQDALATSACPESYIVREKLGMGSYGVALRAVRHC